MKSYIRRQYKLSVPATYSSASAFYKGVSAAVEEWCKEDENRGADVTKGDGYWQGKREASATITYDAPMDAETGDSVSDHDALLSTLSAKLPQCTYVHYTKRGVWFDEVDLNDMRTVLSEVDEIDEVRRAARLAFFAYEGTVNAALNEAFDVIVEALS